MASDRIVSDRIYNRTDLLMIADDPELLLLGKEICAVYGFSADYFLNLAEFLSYDSLRQSPAVFILSLLSRENGDEKKAVLDSVRHVHPRVPLIAIVQGDESPAEMEMIKQAGATYIVNANEVLQTSKLFYLTSLVVHGSFLPISMADLFPSTEISFNAYHKLTLNQKYLPVIFEGFVLSDKKYRRLEVFPQVYVHRKDLDSYRKYIEAYNDRSGRALRKRCRANLMSLMGIYSELTLLLTMDAEVGRSEVLQQKLETYQQIFASLADHLKDCADVWNVVIESLDLQFCRYERGPMILAYATLIAAKLTLPCLKDLALAVLLSDIGLVELPQNVYKNFLQTGPDGLSAEEAEVFKTHVDTSLSRARLRELPLPPELEQAVLCTHERQDGTGFPHQVSGDKIPEESQLIQFCEVLDRRVRQGLQNPATSHEALRKELWDLEKEHSDRFSAEFLDKIASVVVTSAA